MTWDWQNVGVLVLVIAACAYLGRRAWLTLARKRAAACGGCAQCPSAQNKGELPLVALATSAREKSETRKVSAGSDAT